MIGHKLKVARSASGLSLRALADAMDGIVSAQAIGKYERDEDMPSSRVLMALAATLNVTEEYLLSEDELVLRGSRFSEEGRNVAPRGGCAGGAHDLHARALLDD